MCPTYPAINGGKGWDMRRGFLSEFSREQFEHVIADLEGLYKQKRYQIVHERSQHALKSGTEDNLSQMYIAMHHNALVSWYQAGKGIETGTGTKATRHQRAAVNTNKATNPTTRE
jgi:hypothetical protein